MTLEIYAPEAGISARLKRNMVLKALQARLETMNAEIKAEEHKEKPDAGYIARRRAKIAEIRGTLERAYAARQR